MTEPRWATRRDPPAPGARTTDGLVVTEIWESKGHQERFMGARLQPALTDVAVPPPTHVIESDIVNQFQRG